MAVLHTEHIGCPVCDNAWFVPKEYVVISKESTEDHPIILRTRTDYHCSTCDIVYYSTDKEGE